MTVTKNKVVAVNKDNVKLVVDEKSVALYLIDKARRCI